MSACEPQPKRGKRLLFKDIVTPPPAGATSEEKLAWVSTGHPIMAHVLASAAKKREIGSFIAKYAYRAKFAPFFDSLATDVRDSFGLDDSQECTGDSIRQHLMRVIAAAEDEGPAETGKTEDNLAPYLRSVPPGNEETFRQDVSQVVDSKREHVHTKLLAKDAKAKKVEEDNLAWKGRDAAAGLAAKNSPDSMEAKSVGGLQAVLRVPSPATNNSTAATVTDNRSGGDIFDDLVKDAKHFQRQQAENQTQLVMEMRGIGQTMAATMSQLLANVARPAPQVIVASPPRPSAAREKPSGGSLFDDLQAATQRARASPLTNLRASLLLSEMKTIFARHGIEAEPSIDDAQAQLLATD